MDWKTIYIFVSSTFKDMHAERDYLSKFVFPVLAEWCSKYKLKLIDVDLRWGVTEIDAIENKRTVEVCLENIDKCRPLFLCFLGQRRGWVPTYDDVSAKTFEKYPALSDAIQAGLSVTEMEICHAVISPFKRNLNPSQPFFYFRNPSYIEQIKKYNPALIEEQVFTNSTQNDDRILCEIKEIIKNKCKNVIEYLARWDPTLRTPELVALGKTDNDSLITEGRLKDFQSADGRELKDIIIEQMKEAIKNDPEISERFTNSDSEEFDEDVFQQEEYLYTMADDYIESDGEYADLVDYINSDSADIFLVSSEPGMGKTSYIANFIKNYREYISDAPVLYRFAGQSKDSNMLDLMILSLTSKLGVSFSMLSEKKCIFDTDVYRLIYSKIEEKRSEKAFVPILFFDDAEALEKEIDDLCVFFKALSPLVKLVITWSKEESETQSKLKNRFGHYGLNVRTFELHGFSSKKILNFTNNYFAKYLKNLDDEAVGLISQRKSFQNPQLLRLFVNDLRLYGSFEGLVDRINSYPETLESAFVSLINNLNNEMDYFFSFEKSRIVTPVVLYGVASFRCGVKQELLAEIISLFFKGEEEIPLETSLSCIKHIIRRLNDFLEICSGLVTVKNATLKNVILDEYKELKKAVDLAISTVFIEKLNIDDPYLAEKTDEYIFRECGYALSKLDNIGVFSRYLSNYKYLYWKCKKCGIDALLMDFSLLDDSYRTEAFISIENSLKKSAHILRSQPEQFAFQFFDGLTMAVSADNIKKYMHIASQLDKIPLMPISFSTDNPGLSVENFWTGIYSSNIMNLDGDLLMTKYFSDEEIWCLATESLLIDKYRVPEGTAFVVANSYVCVYNSREHILYINCRMQKLRKMAYYHNQPALSVNTELFHVFDDKLYYIVKESVETPYFKLVVYDSNKNQEVTVSEIKNGPIQDFYVNENGVFIVIDNKVVFPDRQTVSLNEKEKVVGMYNNYLISIRFSTAKGDSLDCELIIVDTSKNKRVYSTSIWGFEVKIKGNKVYANTAIGIIEIDLEGVTVVLLRHWFEEKPPFGFAKYCRCLYNSFEFYDDILITYNTYERTLKFFDLTKKAMLNSSKELSVTLNNSFALIGRKIYVHSYNTAEMLYIIDLQNIHCLPTTTEPQNVEKISFMKSNFYLSEAKNVITRKRINGEVIKRYSFEGKMIAVSEERFGIFAFATCVKSEDTEQIEITIDRNAKDNESRYVKTVVFSNSVGPFEIEIISENQIAILHSYKVQLLDIDTGKSINNILNHAYVLDNETLYAVGLTAGVPKRIQNICKCGDYLICTGADHSKSSVWNLRKMQELSSFDVRKESYHRIRYTATFADEYGFVVAVGVERRGFLYRYNFDEDNLILAHCVDFDKEISCGAQTEKYIFVVSDRKLCVCRIDNLKCVFTVDFADDVVNLFCSDGFLSVVFRNNKGKKYRINDLDNGESLQT